MPLKPNIVLFIKRIERIHIIFPLTNVSQLTSISLFLEFRDLLHLDK